LQNAAAEYNAYPKGHPQHQGLRPIAAKYAASGINFSNLRRFLFEGVEGKRKQKPNRGGDDWRDQVSERLKLIYENDGKIIKTKARSVVRSRTARMEKGSRHQLVGQLAVATS
jgi:hypothetical protein